MSEHDRGWQETGASYGVTWAPSLLDRRGRWDVVMNGYQHHASYLTMEQAQREAARMNYMRGSYRRPHMFGMDGVS